MCTKVCEQNRTEQIMKLLIGEVIIDESITCLRKIDSSIKCMIRIRSRSRYELAVVTIEFVKKKSVWLVSARFLQSIFYQENYVLFCCLRVLLKQSINVIYIYYTHERPNELDK